MSDVRVRAIGGPDDPAIHAFGELQARAYFDPDMLIPAAYVGRILTVQTAERRNFLLVAEHDGRVIGGTLFHAFPLVGTGFSSFMATAPDVRGRGVARVLHDARFRTLDDAAGGRVTGVFIDVVNPGRLTPDELARERAVGSDPVARRRVFARLGFRQVGVRYEQPVGGENGGPVTNMDLLYCPRDPAVSVPVRLVADTMRAYWRDWLGAARTEQAARALEARAGGATELSLLTPEGA